MSAVRPIRLCRVPDATPLLFFVDPLGWHPGHWFDDGALIDNDSIAAAIDRGDAVITHFAQLPPLPKELQR